MGKIQETKRYLASMSLWEQECIEEFLADQAEQGWMLEKMGSFYWHFRKAEPKKRKFSVVYFLKTDDFHATPTEEMKEFYEFLAHDGWYPVTSEAGKIQVFCNEHTEPRPVETEVTTKVEVLHRMWKCVGLKMCILCLAVAIGQLLALGWGVTYMPITLLADNMAWGVVVCSLALIGAGIGAVISHYRWYKKAQVEARERNTFLPTRLWMRELSWLYIMLVTAGLAFQSLRVFRAVRAVVFLLVILVLVVVVAGTFEVCVAHGKRAGMTAKKNRKRSVLVAAILLTAIGILMFLVLAVFGDGGYFNKREPEMTYEYDGSTFEIYKDELPLTLERLTGEAYDEQYSYEMRLEQKSFLINHYIGWQSPCEDVHELPDLRYEIVEIKYSLVYELCEKFIKDELEHDYGKGLEDESERLIMVEATAWGAQKAYQLYHGDEAKMTFVLCYSERIVKLEFDYRWNLTNAQKTIVGEVFGK